MSTNVGTTDRIIRSVIALAAVILAAITGFGSTLGIVLIVVAVIAAITAAVRLCPLYSLLGINTCPRDPSAPSAS